MSNQYPPIKHHYEWDILYVECRKCWIDKDASNYRKDKSSMLWIEYICKDCQKIIWKEKKDKVNTRRKELYSMNKNKFNEARRYKYKNDKTYREKTKSNAWLYRESNREKCKEYQKEYRKNNKEKYLSKNKEYAQVMSEIYWYNWKSFHEKSRTFVVKNWLRPMECCVCHKECDVEIHHPSYESRECRKDVVFVCKLCHENIHSWAIECPKPIDLLKCKKQNNEH